MFKALNANAHPGEIAHAFACGVLLGFLPKNSVLWYVFFIFCFFLRINKGAYLLTIVFASLCAPLLDSVFDTVGYMVLTLPSLQGMFRTWLDTPFIAFTRFNNSIVAGSLIISLVGYIPFYFFIRLFVSLWRKTLQPLLVRNPLAKAFMNLPLFRSIAAAAQKLEQ